MDGKQGSRAPAGAGGDVNVLYLTINPNRQSTTVPTEGWFRCLSARGLRPVLVSHEIGDFHQWAVAEGHSSYRVPLPHPSKANPLPFLQSLWKLRSIVRKHDIELIHCNEQDCYPIGSYLARVLGLPIVVSVHFTMARGFCEWAFDGWRCPQRMYFVSRRSMDTCAENLHGTVERSRWLVLHNGLDLGRYVPSEQLRREFRNSHGLAECIVVGVACALRPRKQVEHLIEAAANISNPNLRVLLAGGAMLGDEEYGARLVEFGKSKLGPRFQYLGYLDDLRPMCNGLDLFINTSREESFGIAPLEAMACGCPVVGYDSKAVDEVVLPEGGQIVSQDDRQQLTRAISEWIGDGERLATSRELARRQATRFDIAEISEQLWRDYDSILGDEVGRERSVACQTG